MSEATYWIRMSGGYVMKQIEAINAISETVKKDSAVRAIFLKGSIARNDLDDYSDVDFYCIVKDEDMEFF